MMTVGDVLKQLIERPDTEPFVLALGKGRIVGPAKLVQLRGQALPPAGYYAVHTDQTQPGEMLTVCAEDPRADPAH